MALIYKEYPEYSKVVEDDSEFEVFSISTVAKIIGKTTQTLRLWDTWSKDREAEGLDRLIPESYRIGKNRVRCWSAEQVHQIKKFSDSIKYGDLATYSRTCSRPRATAITRDPSTDTRRNKRTFRSKVNADGKRAQKRLKVQKILSAKGTMLRAVRTRARSIYDQIKY